MLKKSVIVIYVLCTLGIYSCKDNNANNAATASLALKEKELALKELELKNKESQLLEDKKNALDQKEKDLQAKESKLELTNTIEKISLSKVSPEIFVADFIRDLGKRNFDNAYYKCKMPTVTNLAYFKSDKAYGGIVKTVLGSARTTYESSSSAIVEATYYAEDPSNRSGQFTQKFQLKEYDGVWKITKMENLSVNYYN